MDRWTVDGGSDGGKGTNRSQSTALPLRLSSSLVSLGWTTKIVETGGKTGGVSVFSVLSGAAVSLLFMFLWSFDMTEALGGNVAPRASFLSHLLPGQLQSALSYKATQRPRCLHVTTSSLSASSGLKENFYQLEERLCQKKSQILRLKSKFLLFVPESLLMLKIASVIWKREKNVLLIQTFIQPLR